MDGLKQKLVSVDEASISKLSVEIKTISVGRRQMSMALFRQLPHQPLIDVNDADLRLNGMPWGRVNYHWEGAGCNSRGAHIHVLWQRDSTLFRSSVQQASPPEIEKYGKRQFLYEKRFQELLALEQLFIAA